MIYFFCVQAQFTHGEDGIQGVPQGVLFGLFKLPTRRDALLLVLASSCLAFW